MSQINTQIVAYDFFDTIVHRKCHPETVLYEWAKRCARYLKFHVKASEIYNQRKRIEKARKRRGTEELNYRELIAQLCSVLKRNGLLVAEEDFYRFSWETEVVIELENLYLDEERISEIRKLFQRGKEIIIISDFYLGEDFFDEVLKKLGIRHLFSKIFISSEYGKRKASGSLYLLVCRQMHCNPEDITMCGDNKISDYKIPKLLGFQTRFLKYTSGETVINERKLNSIYRKLTHKNQIENPISGYTAEILYFISKLYESAISEGIDELLFCSREGQFMKELFDIYQSVFLGDIFVQSRYFYVSRKAVLVPSLREMEQENFDMIFRQYSELTVLEFMESIGLKKTFILKFCNENRDIHIEDKITCNPNDRIIGILKKDSVFRKEYDTTRKDQKECFLQYFDTFCKDKDKIAIVDVGWKGTIQDCIQRILQNNVEIQGYYIGLTIIPHKFSTYTSILVSGIL